MNYDALSGKSVLLLGKSRALNAQEFETLLQLHGIKCLKRYEEGVALIIEGRMMNPLEQNESERLYEARVAPIVPIEGLEAWLCRSIEPNRLLMSLKLSRDQERLVDFLKNPYITEELFFKLLRLYDWQNEGLFDNDRNRDVTASIIGRFYKDLERNHNVQYAMSGLAHLIEGYGTRDLIEAVAALSPVARELKTPYDPSLRGVIDVMALHPQTPETILRALLPTHGHLLSRRVPLMLEEELLGDPQNHPILAQNESLSEKGGEALAEGHGQSLARHWHLHEERFGRFFPASAKELASNPSLTPEMQQQLMELEDGEVWRAMAVNPVAERSWLHRLFEQGGFEAELAANPSLEAADLEILSRRDNPKVLEALAANPSTPIEILYQLSLDRRFERSVKTNPAFGTHIQTHNIGWN
ncbi:MAG: hypothetical protein JXK04_07340 [Campylobacterales bacterium]|nr:hypothetical protein [Campylobacterales bacterium]